MFSAQLLSRRRVKAQARGFTLVELMTVVAIVGILATIGIVLVRNHMSAAKTTSAMAAVKWVLSGQTAFRAEHGQYLDCSGTSARYYPMQTPSQQTYAWAQPSHPDYARWASLGIPTVGGTQFGYLVNAGLEGQPYPTLQTTTDPALQIAKEPWYVIQFASDLDGDGVFMRGVATSLSAEVYVELEGE